MILTDKDSKTLENNSKFKSVELNENFVNVDNDQNFDETRPESPEVLTISLFEAKKLNEAHLR